jgi:hypothetical protein
MKRVMITAMSLGAVFAVMVSSVAAEGTGPKVTLRTAKGLLVKGQSVTGFSSDLVFTTSAGNLECTENTLTGFDKTNVREKPSGEITTEKSTGTGGGLCNTTTPFGKASIESQNLGWKLKLTNKGVEQINSSHGDKTVTFVSTFPEAGGAHCAFASKKVLATFPVSATPVPANVTTTNQVFKLKAGSTAGCPTEGKLSGHFTTTSNGEPVEVEVN